MFKIVSHKFRQFYYGLIPLYCSKVFFVFKKLFSMSDAHWEDVVYSKENNGFVISNFKCSELAAYSGKEIAFFNHKQVYVFWLPGASHSGQGKVENGLYKVHLACSAMQYPITVSVFKNDGNTVIKDYSLSDDSLSKADCLAGGYVLYRAIEKEIKLRVVDGIISLPKSISAKFLLDLLGRFCKL